jgi:hypothetical protein
MRRDCIILGSGRSGTSLAAGMLADAGYFMGGELWPGNVGNPKGYFEDREVNWINDELLAPLTPMRPVRRLFRWIRTDGYPLTVYQRWLAVVPPDSLIPCPSEIGERIKAATSHRPFCFKDPRFCYTLPLWRPYIGDAVMLCVFRHPGITANSILTECNRAEYLKGIRMDFGRALEVWEMMYRHVVEVHYPRGGDWLFVHYDQLLDGSARTRIEELLQVRTDREFADGNLKRSATVDRIAPRLLRLYERLCELADL